MSFDNLPRGWQLISLEDAMDAIIDYRGKTPKKTESGIPLITAKIVKGGYVLEPFEALFNFLWVRFRAFCSPVNPASISGITTLLL